MTAITHGLASEPVADSMPDCAHTWAGDATGTRCDACQSCDAACDAIHDVMAVHRILSTAVVAHGFEGHLSDVSDAAESATVALLESLALWSDDMVRGYVLPDVAATARLGVATVWNGQSARVAAAWPLPESRRDYRPEYVSRALTAGEIRTAVHTWWEALTEATAEMARDRAYCSAYSSAIAQAMAAMRTPDVPEPVGSMREYRVTVPVTVTLYVDAYVTAADESDARDMASDEVGTYSIREAFTNGWDGDWSADWSDADVEMAE